MYKINLYIYFLCEYLNFKMCVILFDMSTKAQFTREHDVQTSVLAVI